MRTGLKVMSVVNGAAFVGHMSGVPIPSAPGAWKEMANNAVGSLDKKSSVDEFDVLQGFTMAGNMPNSLPAIGHGSRCERQAFTGCYVGRLGVLVRKR
jgi:hypothetical protein